MPAKTAARKSSRRVINARKPATKKSAKKKEGINKAAKRSARRKNISIPDSPILDNLKKIEHIVVLMMENRSFDQMLGYLTLEEGRTDIDGLTKSHSNLHNGKPVRVRHFKSTVLTDAQDPCHKPDCVVEQLKNNNGGFVANYARTNTGDPDPGTVMGYYNGADLPLYDYLAKEFCVCDRWFSPVPGATWPNRLYAVAGRADKSKDNLRVPLYRLPSFVRHLDAKKVSWKWYSHEKVVLRITTLRLSDDKYRIKGNHKAFNNDFFDDAARGTLPAVSWIDPNFVDFGGPNGSNDDHPPADVLAGQELALKIYHALVNSPQWKKTLFIITYDEHGGFFDHVPPPEAQDDDPNFRSYGVRVPALLVSPFVERKSVSHTEYDHTSIIKTILLRFCRGKDGSIPDMGARVNNARHLGEVLTESTPRAAPAQKSYQTVIDKIAAWHQQKFQKTMSVLAAPKVTPKLSEFQQGLLEASKRITQIEKTPAK